MITDDFNDNTRGSMWRMGVGSAGCDWCYTTFPITETGQQLRLTYASTNGYDAYITVNRYDMTGAFLSIETVSAPPNSGGTVEGGLAIEFGSNNTLELYKTGNNTLEWAKRVSGTWSTIGSVTYDATNHKFLRMRHDVPSDTIKFETSADNSSWTIQASIARWTAITSTYLMIYGGGGGSPGGTADGVFDNFATTAVLSSFTYDWPFTAGTTASYSFNSSKIDFTGGSSRLTPTDQVDDDNTSAGFSGATQTGTSWDTTNSYVRLTQTGSPTNNSELDSSWTPAWSSITAYWKMNNTWTDSVGSNNGTAGNGATFTTTSKLGSHAGSFDGVNDYVSVGDTTALDFGTGAFSISAWIKPPNSNQVAPWIIKRDDTIMGIGISSTDSFSWTSGKRLTFLIYQDGSNFRGGYSNYDVADGNWHHVVWTGNGTSMALYVDGYSMPITMDYVAGSWPNLTNPGSALGYLGYDPGNSNAYKGSLDEVAVWKGTALSAAQVRTIYERQSAKYAGTVTSRVMDALATGMSWTNLSWIPTLPFLKSLPDYSGGVQNETSTSYSSLVGSTGSVGDNDLMTGIKGLWHFAGTFGASIADSATVSDSSGSARTGTVTNTNGTGMSYVAGRLDTGIEFDGIDDYIDAGTTTLGVSTAMTVSAWVFVTSDAGDCRVVSKHGASYGWLISRMASSDSVEFKISTNGTNWNGGTTSAGSFPINQWLHIVGVYNGTNMRVYINGVENTTLDFPATVSGSINDSTQRLQMGRDNLSGGNYFKGRMDEVAIWNRALHASEVKQLYRRGGNRIKHQIRICTASDCSDDSTGANWKGPDGTNQTYFSEVYNMSSQSATPSGTVLKTLPQMTFSNFTSPPGTSRYFQYRAILESDDASTNCNYGSGATWCTPELKSVTVDPTHYDSSAATIYGLNGQSYLTLTGFTQTLGSGGCSSGVVYNLSRDKATWYYWNGSAWAASNGTAAQANAASVVNSNISAFATSPGTGTIYMKAFLQSSGTSACELDNVQVTGAN